jgi:hypothetical protein
VAIKVKGSQGQPHVEWLRQEHHEQAIIQEALSILSQTMTPSEMVVLISRWWSDSGDYLRQRDDLFANETVDSLAQKNQAFEHTHPRNEA